MPGKPKKACAVPGCGLTKNAPVHSGSMWEHDFVDPSKQDWRKRKAEQLKSEPECALRDKGLGDCWNPRESNGKNDANHVVPRGAGGTSHDDSPLVTLCRKHHDYIEEHREWARENGYLARRKP